MHKELSVKSRVRGDFHARFCERVRVKLPRSTRPMTHVGNYSPDWAIAFQEGAVKHVYFVAETKGIMSSLDLREIERGKIACAEKLFDQLSTAHVRYGKVDGFETLMQLVNAE